MSKHAAPMLPPPGTRCLITGISGQDGYYLAELLLARGCRVIGTTRSAEEMSDDDQRREMKAIEFVACDLADGASIGEMLAATRPEIVYHLAAQSSVKRSWEDPVTTARVNALGTLELLEGLRRHAPGAAFVMAGSCECYDHEAAGELGVTPATPFKVTNPYAASKVMAQQMTTCFRNEHGLRASVAIFFNHTSPRRPELFVERGIVRRAVRVKLGLDEAVPVGSWETRRDWSWAPELMEAFAAMGTLTEPCDLVLASGHTMTIRDWITESFLQLGLDPDSQVRVDPSRLHQGDRQHTHGNIEQTRRVLGWSPHMTLKEMVGRLIEHDMRALKMEHGMRAD